MDNSTTKHLCMNLIRADTEDEVLTLLKGTGYWDNPDAWRYYGDTKNNYSTIGGQQSRPESSLVEKIVNSIDARLTSECLIRGIDPQGDEAPKSIREAVATYFEENPQGYTAGLVSEWSPTKRTEVARGITVAATGAKPREGSGRPCFTISDNGEGQTPEMMPYTFLSIDSENKQRVPFVQGKFNMGGTGALRFCGYNNLQLIVSRRNPKLLDGHPKSGTDHHWGFTIVRRENPPGFRSSIYTFLAPNGSDEHPNKGNVLTFQAESIPIFPEGNKPYARHSEWETLVKLYEYKATGFKSHILMSDGLLSRVDLLLPSLALPARFHECRDYGGHSGSPETTVTGLNVRLRDDKANNVEDDFPITDLMNIGGEQMPVTIYVFKKGKAQTYRKREGVIFTVNGQTHGYLPTDFFRRQETGCTYLRDSLLVAVDCGKLSGRSVEDLFMTSRDRLSGDELRVEIQKNLADILKNNQLLRRLKNRRQQEQRDAKLDHSKPMEDILRAMIKKSPTLTQLFLRGDRLSNPYRTTEVEGEDEPYVGKKHPTYFKFRGKESGAVLSRDCHINRRCRIPFETDVVNDYFGRDIDAGEFLLFQVGNREKVPYDGFTLNMQNGIATLNLQLPSSCSVGDELRYEAVVTDRTLIKPFINRFYLKVKEKAKPSIGKKTKRKQPPGKKKGKDREKQRGLALPTWTEVYEHSTEDQKGWEDMDPPFDKFSALRIRGANGEPDEEGEQNQEVYDFYVNVDNIYLKNEKKYSKRDPKTMTACFVWGMVLIGMALIDDDIRRRKGQAATEEEESGEANGIHIEDKVEDFTRAIAYMLLPMIETLSGLDDNEETTDHIATEAA